MNIGGFHILNPDQVIHFDKYSYNRIIILINLVDQQFIELFDMKKLTIDSNLLPDWPEISDPPLARYEDKDDEDSCSEIQMG